MTKINVPHAQVCEASPATSAAPIQYQRPTLTRLGAWQVLTLAGSIPFNPVTQLFGLPSRTEES